MKMLFLTSSLGGYQKILKNGIMVKEIIKCDNSSHFIDKLKEVLPKINKMVFVASNPDGASKTDEYSNVIKQALNLDDFEIKELAVIDHRFAGNIEETILSADLLFLAGGHVPTQNKYFEEIDLKRILNKYNGVIIGQSAGSMNCADIVYCPPELDEEVENANFVRYYKGLGLTKINVLPHYSDLKEMTICGKKYIEDIVLPDSYKTDIITLNNGGFVVIKNDKTTIYGESYLIRGGKITQINKQEKVKTM